MKNKLLSLVNRCLVTLVAFLGFQCCVSCVCKYGVPYKELQVKGKVTNTQQEPLKHMQVVVTPNRDTLYTNAKGEYHYWSEHIGLDSISVTVHDTAGMYASDSVRVPTVYLKEKDRFEATADVELKEKE